MDAAEAARDVNVRVSRIGRDFDPGARLLFLCECGCMEHLELASVEYDAAGGAWAPGHRERLSHPAKVRSDARIQSFRALDAMQRAEALREEAEALIAQARQILKRKAPDPTNP